MIHTKKKKKMTSLLSLCRFVDFDFFETIYYNKFFLSLAVNFFYYSYITFQWFCVCVYCIYMCDPDYSDHNNQYSKLIIYEFSSLLIIITHYK